MFVHRLREAYESAHLNVTESHPKALLAAWGNPAWNAVLDEYGIQANIDDDQLHERDAILSIIAAREGFSGRWLHDLAEHRYDSEIDPQTSWIGPLHYFWFEE